MLISSNLSQRNKSIRVQPSTSNKKKYMLIPLLNLTYLHKMGLFLLQ